MVVVGVVVRLSQKRRALLTRHSRLCDWRRLCVHSRACGRGSRCLGSLSLLGPCRCRIKALVQSLERKGSPPLCLGTRTSWHTPGLVLLMLIAITRTERRANADGHEGVEHGRRERGHEGLDRCREELVEGERLARVAA